MKQRIKTLREKSLNAVNTISHERAVLITEFYQSKQARNMSTPVKRASAFKHILANKELYLDDGELIVGERGPAPKATPTYPEICLHTLEDLETLHSREKVNFLVSPETRGIYAKEIIPYWSGNNNRDRVMAALPEAWHKAYEAGMFTEFQEQRAPGHTVSGTKPFEKGLLEIKKEIQASIAVLDYFGDPLALDKHEELTGMEIAADAMLLYAGRHADKLKELAEAEADQGRKRELEAMSEICERVPAHAPRTFWEALQAYWFIHLGVITEVNPWDSYNPGRLDQHLIPFYRQEIAEGSLTEERAIELLQAFWVKFNNHPSPPKMGVTGKESATYTDFCLINLGGVKPDGTDAVNELSYLILDVIEEMRLLQPSSMVQVSKKNPDRFLKRAIKITSTGFGQPSIFNTDAIVQELTRQGKHIMDARRGGASGCVESGAFGTEAYILTGYFNIPKVLEVTLNNGRDPMTGELIGLETGDPAAFETFEELKAAFRMQLQHFADIKIQGNNIIHRIFAVHLPVPFLSLYIDDCIARGMDYNAGGARYNTSYIQGVGMGSITDELAALKYNVYDNGKYTLAEVLTAMREDFQGHDKHRNDLLNHSPKYGNDDDYADDLTREVFEMYFESVDGRRSSLGGRYRVNLLPTTCHIYFGEVTGAMPDGRKAGKPLSEGISPVQGADRHGPTSVIKSAAKIDHLRTGGTLLNQKFTPEVLKNDEGITKAAQLVRSYFKLDGHHVQFNCVTAETLRKAQANPQDYSDLIVRVAGYSDYFKDLCLELQEEIIQRTEQEFS